MSASERSAAALGLLQLSEAVTPRAPAQVPRQLHFSNEQTPPRQPSIRQLYERPISCDWGGVTHVDGGLQNVGNSCFLKATLQALFHIPPFIDRLDHDQEHAVRCRDTWGCVTCGVRSVLTEMRAHGSATPILFYSMLSKISPHMVPGKQEDAHEFLIRLLSKLEEEFMQRFPNPDSIYFYTRMTTPVGHIFGAWMTTYGIATAFIQG